MDQPDLDVVLAVHERSDRTIEGFDGEHLLYPTTSRDKKFFGRVMDEILPDIVHDHGIWMANNHQVVRAAHKREIPVVVCPRGMLEPWPLTQGKWKKKAAWWLYQRWDLKLASMLHATAESEADQYRRLGLRQPIAVIPNGVTFPKALPERVLHGDGRHRALFLSRIHPKKGLLELVEAWSILKPSDWILEIVGTDANDYQCVVERAVQDKGLEDTVVFTGSLDDEKKWDAYSRADLFVLPTYSENFGIVIAEALHAGVPVITSKAAPWKELEGHSEHEESVGENVSGIASKRTGPISEFTANGRCGWWTDVGLDPLVPALREALTLSDEEREQMGVNGRRLVAREYTWSSLAKNMKNAYTWLLHGGSVPDCVRDSC